jgi:hypothetical protein
VQIDGGPWRPASIDRSRRTDFAGVSGHLTGQTPAPANIRSRRGRWIARNIQPASGRPTPNSKANVLGEQRQVTSGCGLRRHLQDPSGVSGDRSGILVLAALLGACTTTAPVDHSDTSAAWRCVWSCCGEVHDNAQQHQLRLEGLQRAFASGWRPAIAMSSSIRNIQRTSIARVSNDRAMTALDRCCRPWGTRGRVAGMGLL